MLHDEAVTPDEGVLGVLPIFAVQDCELRKSVPVTVTVEPTYAEVGDGVTPVMLGGPRTLSASLMVVAISFSTFDINAVPALLDIVISMS